MRQNSSIDQCITEVENNRNFRSEIPEIVENLVNTCTEDRFDHVKQEPLPSPEAIIEIINSACRILYPGYFSKSKLDVNLPYYFGQEATVLFEALSQQIFAALRHECFRDEFPCVNCERLSQSLAVQFLRTLPDLRGVLATDVRAAYDGDPAAKTYDEIIFSYPGLFAITIYRMAHQLHTRKVPLIPRIMTEYAHRMTGIDIHPGAKIGHSFFIDHGTGVVIGETTEIGNRVRIYQGVTLGALSVPKRLVNELRTKKRHPTLEDDVIIYAAATILGGDTVIGARSVIGGNVWLTASVGPDTKVFIKKPELVYEEHGREKSEE